MCSTLLKVFPHYFVLLLVLVYQNHLWANGKQFAAAVDWHSAMSTILACCFLFSTISLNSHNMKAASVSQSSAAHEPWCHGETNHRVYSPDEKPIHLCLHVWVNSLTPGVWCGNKVGWRDAQRDRGSQWERRRQGWREERRDEGMEEEKDGGRDVMEVCSVPGLSLFLSFWLPASLSSLRSEGQRGDRAAVLTQVKASQPGTASHSSSLPFNQRDILAESKFPTVRHTWSELWHCKDIYLHCIRPGNTVGYTAMIKVYSSHSESL